MASGSLLHDSFPFWHHDLPAEIPWVTDRTGHYYRLLRLRGEEAALSGVGGVYILWHRGATPRWIYVGWSDDLNEALARARDSAAILTYELEGGVYVTWTLIKHEYRSGVVNALKAKLKPLIEEDLDTTLDTKAEPILVTPPG